MITPTEPTEAAGLESLLRSLAHALRTPVSITMVWAQLLREGRLDAARQTDALAAIEEAAREQKRLIDLFGDAARLLGGRVEMHRQPTDIAALVEESTALIGERAAERGILVRCHDSHVAEAIVAVDADRLRQALSHLFANALHATRRGDEITVTTRSSAQQLAIDVEDSGCGIDPRILPHCFTTSLHAKRAELDHLGEPLPPAAGVGLGLLIVRRIAELHGGQATIRSDGVGRGTTATITLPIEPTATSL
jgi:signal transduction histidine kinase